MISIAVLAVMTVIALALCALELVFTICFWLPFRIVHFVLRRRMIPMTQRNLTRASGGAFVLTFVAVVACRIQLDHNAALAAVGIGAVALGLSLRRVSRLKGSRLRFNGGRLVELWRCMFGGAAARARQDAIRSYTAASSGFCRHRCVRAARLAAAAAGAGRDAPASFKNSRHADGRPGIAGRSACRARSARPRCPPEIQGVAGRKTPCRSPHAARRGAQGLTTQIARTGLASGAYPRGDRAAEQGRQRHDGDRVRHHRRGWQRARTSATTLPTARYRRSKSRTCARPSAARRSNTIRPAQSARTIFRGTMFRKAGIEKRRGYSDRNVPLDYRAATSHVVNLRDAG